MREGRAVPIREGKGEGGQWTTGECLRGRLVPVQRAARAHVRPEATAEEVAEEVAALRQHGAVRAQHMHGGAPP